MPTNRSTVLGGVWADGAPDPPVTPVADTTYADSGLLPAEIEEGWPYAKIVDSAKFNEFLRRASVLLTSLEENGVLPWCPSTAYATGAWVLGSTGLLYQATGATTGEDPTTTPGKWATPLTGTVAATASRLVLRDASGRAQVAAPSAAADIARKDTVDAHAGTRQAHGIYSGRVPVDGVVDTALPSGWTCDRTAEGRYRITHNLGTTGVVLTGAAENPSANYSITVHPEAYSSNYVDVRVTRADPNGLIDCAFGFILAVR